MHDDDQLLRYELKLRMGPRQHHFPHLLCQREGSMSMRAKVIGIALGMLCAIAPAYAAVEGDTMTTTSTQCRQILGYCETTTTYFVYTSGQWWPVMVTSTRTSYTNEVK